MQNFHFKLILSLAGLFLVSGAFAQRSMNYKSTWMTIDSLILKRLPQSALTETDKLIDAAYRAGHTTEYIKGIAAKAYLAKTLSEDEWIAAIEFLKLELPRAKEPAKQVIHSNLAGLYQFYLNEVRYEIRNRTDIAGEAGPDIRAWTQRHFYETIYAHADSSLQNAPLLLRTRTSDITNILSSKTDHEFRPTLYDLLAQDALDILAQDEPGLGQSVTGFKLDNTIVLSPLNEFVQAALPQKDTRNKYWDAIQIFQDLLKHHKDNNEVAALVDWEIKRLAFAREAGNFTGKDSLFRQAIEALYQEYGQTAEGAMAGVELAEWLVQKGNEYVPGSENEETKTALNQALELAEKIAAQFPKSNAGIRASNLAAQLRKSELSIETENVNSISKPFRALLRFKNLDQVYIRVVAMDYSSKSLANERQEGEDVWWTKHINLKPVQSRTQKLPDAGDLRSHSAEIKIDGLPQGKYMVLVSGSPNFSLSREALAASVFYVSNLAHVRSDENFFVLDRNTGQPKANATVQLWYSSYDYATRQNKITQGKSYTTDRNGRAQIPKESWNENRQRQTFYEYKTGDDRLLLASGYRDFVYGNLRNPDNSEINNASYSIFLDRGLYRPGQIVFFKAIGTTMDSTTGRSKLFIPDSVTVQIKDANYQLIDSVALKPNSFGSVSGSFLLPTGRMSGTYRLEVLYGSRQSQTHFQVEEYKRPQFEATFEKIKERYSLNDTVRVLGKATAYAGQAIDGAEVSYRVYRTSRLFRPMRFGRSIWPPYNPERVEITNGTTTTDQNGNFTVQFAAIPDLTLNEKWQPAFMYTVEASITDRNGETRNAQTSITLSNVSTVVTIAEGPTNRFDADSAKTVEITATNVQGEKVPANINVQLFKLVEPAEFLRKRYWEAPDTSVMSRAEFKQLFPTDPYGNEDDVNAWENGEMVWQKQLAGDSAYTVSLPARSLEPGVYRMIATTVADGDTASTEKLYLVYRLRTSEMPFASVLFDFAEKHTAEPGENALFVFGTAVPETYIIEQTVKTRFEDSKWERKPTFRYIQNKKELEQVAFPVTEQDRGGYGVSRLFVYDNRVYFTNWNIHVPWTNKELDIKLETFRDKIKPGDQETWTVKISGEKKDAVAAEMLASMYDASLDAIMPFNWSRFFPWRTNYIPFNWQHNDGFTTGRNYVHYAETAYKELNPVTYPYIVRTGYNWPAYGISTAGQRFYALDGISIQIMAKESVPTAAREADEVRNLRNEEGLKEAMDTVAVTGDQPPPDGGEENNNDLPQPIRSDFRETVFFYPELKTDEDGNVSFSFTAPDALTSWKMQLLAHNAELQTGQLTQKVITQKELMVQPFAPRFLRQGDQLEFTTKISNTSDKEITGTVRLELLNAATMTPVDGWFNNAIPQQHFTVEAGQSTLARFPMVVPMQFTEPIVYRIVANSANHNDGEERILPILSNKTLVTETLPVYLRNQKSKTINWQKLLDSENSNTLVHHSLTAEYTANPTWYAVQALPYLKANKDETITSTWNRFYANALASDIATAFPRIKTIFDQWRTLDTTKLMSNLEKNQELKSALLEETPWVLQAKNESEQKKNIAMLFDVVKLGGELEEAFQKLEEHQSPNGGLVWIKGMRDDPYMTMYVLSQLGHLRKLDAWPAPLANRMLLFAKKGIAYIDARMQEDYDKWMKQQPVPREKVVGSLHIYYLYMRSFFQDVVVPARHQKAYSFIMNDAIKSWTKLNLRGQAIVALVAKRTNQPAVAASILKSLTENSLQSDEMGMYWKELNNPSPYWWGYPIENHALLMEAYHEIENNTTRLNDLKTWLLRNKQTNNWKTTTATADAVYALLLTGGNWLDVNQKVTMQAGSWTVTANTAADGLGYVKETIPGDRVKPEMGRISLQVDTGPQPLITGMSSWGAYYWQYFEEMDKLESNETGLKIEKQLYRLQNTERGPQLQQIDSESPLNVGDRVRVVLRFSSDREMDYVHLKDLRAANFEPMSQLSMYSMQGGLWFFKSPKDLSMNYYFTQLPRGTYTLEYEVMVTHAGTFLDGIATIQCMYAPEFSAYDGGTRVQTEGGD